MLLTKHYLYVDIANDCNYCALVDEKSLDKTVVYRFIGTL